MRALLCWDPRQLINPNQNTVATTTPNKQHSLQKLKQGLARSRRGTCHGAEDLPEFIPETHRGERREPTPASCPDFHRHTQKLINVKVKKNKNTTITTKQTVYRKGNTNAFNPMQKRFNFIQRKEYQNFTNVGLFTYPLGKI